MVVGQAASTKDLSQQGRMDKKIVLGIAVWILLCFGIGFVLGVRTQHFSDPASKQVIIIQDVHVAQPVQLPLYYRLLHGAPQESR